jgi:outer membrane lipoprotein SlyB
MKRLVLAALAAAACGLATAQYNAPAPHDGPGSVEKTPGALCERCGTVQSVMQIKKKGEGGAAGVVGGAVVGGLLGNQIGKGSGRTLATVGGAVAGGYAGNEIQKQATSKTVWVTDVQMKDGTMRRFEHEAQPVWKSGSIVRLNSKGVLVHQRS